MTTPDTLTELVDRLVALRTSRSLGEIELLRKWVNRTDLNSMKQELMTFLEEMSLPLVGKTRIRFVENPDPEVGGTSWGILRDSMEDLKVVDLVETDEVKDLKGKIAQAVDNIQLNKIQLDDIVLSVIDDTKARVLEDGSVVKQLPKEEKETKSPGRTICVHLKDHTVTIRGSNGKTTTFSFFTECNRNLKSDLTFYLVGQSEPGWKMTSIPSVWIPETEAQPYRSLPPSGLYAFLSHCGWPELTTDIPLR